MSSINWDNFKKNSGDFPDRWKPDNVGDKIAGRITSIRIANMPDGTSLPSITIATAEGERELLASQSMLIRRLVEIQPVVGDQISIEFTQIEKLNGGRTLKHFTVEHSRNTTTAENIL